MIISHPFAPLPSCITITSCSKPFSHNNRFIKSSIPPFLLLRNVKTRTLLCSGATSRPSENSNNIGFDIDIPEEDQVNKSNDYGGLSAKEMEMKDVIDIQEEQEYDGDSRKYSSGGPYKGGDEKDFDRNPEFAEILGDYLDDPEKAQSKVSNTF